MSVLEITLKKSMLWAYDHVFFENFKGEGMFKRFRLWFKVSRLKVPVIAREYPRLSRDEVVALWASSKERQVNTNGDIRFILINEKEAVFYRAQPGGNLKVSHVCVGSRDPHIRMEYMV